MPLRGEFEPRTIRTSNGPGLAFTHLQLLSVRARRMRATPTGVAHHPLLLAYLREAHLLADRRDDALAVARRALDLAHQQQERGNWA
jgi:hypothetical protein